MSDGVGPDPTRPGGRAGVRIGRVVGLARYPVKSMAGEQVTCAELTERGMVGDRSWAAYTADGGIASGKTTRRFRRVDGLLDLRARSGADEVPLVDLPDGRGRRADDPSTSAALSSVIGQDLRLRPEVEVAHHDECAVHVITTAGLRHLEQLIGGPVQASRFRANIVLDVEGTGFVEDAWQGRHLVIGPQVVLRLGPGMPRCVMVGLAQPHEYLDRQARLLKVLGQVHDMEFGLQADVVRAGTITCGDSGLLV